jgi:hypothetical protein
MNLTALPASRHQLVSFRESPHFPEKGPQRGPVPYDSTRTYGLGVRAVVCQSCRTRS